MSWDRSPAELRVEPLDWRGPAIELFRRVARGRHPFALLSGTAERGLGRYTILGCDPFRVWELAAGEAAADPFSALSALASRFPVRAEEKVPFAGGLVGYLGYECLRWVERIPVRPPVEPEPPDAWFGAYGAAIVLDAATSEGWIVASGWPEREATARQARAREQIRRLRELARTPAGAAAPPPRSLAQEPRSSLPRERYLRAVRKVLHHIAAGDLYQANLTQRLELDVEEGDAVELFSRLHDASAAPHSAFLDLGRWQVLSSSPERFVSLDAGVAESRPIKGTTGRGDDPADDRRRAEALGRSAKDRAENLMIVDLVRNDLNRVCDQVQVAALAEVETYATLHHLVSTVRGRLRTDRGVADLMRALFPPGSMTGAPKVRAMQILHDLEPVRRGPYAGGLGYLSFDGRLDLSVVIRTVILGGGRARFHVGGGVVADSDPEAELEEGLLKARALRSVLQGRPEVA